MKIKIWPHKPGDGGILCMPLVRNVPEPHNAGWMQTICPACGSDCWETDLARELIENENVTALCTECALRAGMKEDGADG